MGMNSELSNYTISVFELLENKFDIGLDKYPIFDEAYRPILNNAIIQYYMFREIGFANPAVWRQKLQVRMDIIMRNKYNALYKAKQMEFNPLYTMELYETYTHSIDNKGQVINNGTTSATKSANTQNTSSSKNVMDGTNVSNDKSKNNIDNTTITNNNSLGISSSYPSEEMTEDNLTSNLFVDSAQKNKGSENTTNQQNQNTDNSSNSVVNQTSNNTSNDNITSTGNDNITNNNNGTTENNMNESYSKKTIGSASDLTFAHAMTQFKDYCDQFNLDQLVIGELKDLFMSVW
jgi:hypothetical protein